MTFEKSISAGCSMAVEGLFPRRQRVEEGCAVISFEKFGGDAFARPIFVLTIGAFLFLGAPLQGQTNQTNIFLQTLKDARSATQEQDWNHAATLWGEVVKVNPVNSDFWQQRAEALFKIKDYPDAIAADKKLLELGPADFVANVCYDIARTYALMGDKDQSLAWLDRAWQSGWRFPDEARDDDDLKSLRSEPHFQELVGSADAGTMTRDQGWRYDLHLLQHEIYRRSPDPFRHTTRALFESRIAELDTEIPRLRDNQIVVEFLRIMTLVGDGHSIATFGSARPELRRSVPVEFYWFEDGIYIVSADQAHKNLIGKQVLRVNGHEIPEVLDALQPIIPRDNEQWLKTIAPRYLRIPSILNGLGLIPTGDDLPLTLQGTNGQLETTTIRSEDLGLQQASPHFPGIWFFLPEAAKNWISVPQLSDKPLPMYLKHRDMPYWFEYVEQEKVLYFQFNLILDDKKEPLTSFLNRMFVFIRDHDVRAMVVDLRDNPGGDTTLLEPFVNGLIQSKIDQRGKLFVIIGRDTFSAAMNLSVFLERSTDAVFVGEPTGSSPNFVGETVPLQLPYSHLMPCISDLFWQSSWPWDHRKWIAPLVYTPPTFAAYRENRDLAMDSVFDYMRGK